MFHSLTKLTFSNKRFNYQLLSASFCFSKRIIDEVCNSILILLILHQNLSISKTKTTFLATIQKLILHSTLTFRKFQVSKKKKFNDKSYQNPISTFFSHKRFVNTPIWRFGSSMSKIDVFSEVCKNHFCCTKTKMKFRTAIEGRKIWKQKPRRQCVKSVYELVAVRFL